MDTVQAFLLDCKRLLELAEGGEVSKSLVEKFALSFSRPDGPIGWYQNFGTCTSVHLTGPTLGDPRREVQVSVIVTSPPWAMSPNQTETFAAVLLAASAWAKTVSNTFAKYPRLRTTSSEYRTSRVSQDLAPVSSRSRPDENVC